MASIYRCKSCSLEFQVGWDHYHQVHRGATASTSLVCRWCGTWYILDHKIDGTPDELYSRGGPTSAPDWSTTPLLPVPTSHQFRPIRKQCEDLFREGLLDTLELGTFTCPVCNKEGKLTDSWSQDDVTCPRCLEQALTLVSHYLS